MRAAGIPSRVAVGLVYTNGRFGYHMWTEAYLNDWTAFDASMNQDRVDATHIKLTDSSLAETSAQSPFADITRLIGKLEIEVLEVN
jgi:transglutaminase-like putative cysteine protease